MTNLQECEASPSAKESISIVVLWQDEPAHARAVAVCDDLVRRFWAETELAIRWWPFAHLSDEHHAMDAVATAATADMIVLAFQPSGDLPVSLRAGSWRGGVGGSPSPASESLTGDVHNRAGLMPSIGALDRDIIF